MVGLDGATSVAIDALHACRLFAGVDDASLQLVADALRVRRFRRGGGSRQSVNRLLADLVAQGVLRFDGDELAIPDTARAARR